MTVSQAESVHFGTLTRSTRPRSIGNPVQLTNRVAIGHCVLLSVTFNVRVYVTVTSRVWMTFITNFQDTLIGMHIIMCISGESLTFTGSWMIDGVVVESFAIA